VHERNDLDEIWICNDELFMCSCRFETPCLFSESFDFRSHSRELDQSVFGTREIPITGKNKTTIAENQVFIAS